MTEKQIENLKNEIFKAFASKKQPANNNIALHECDECRSVREDFANVKWREASDELLQRNYDKIPLFTFQAFNYFLPAFLIYSLSNFDSPSTVGKFTVYALTPDKKWNEDESSADYWIERFSLFTDEQMNVVYNFLELGKLNPIYEYEFNSIGKKTFDRLKTIKAASNNLKKEIV